VTCGQEKEKEIVSPPRPELELGRSAEYDYDPPEPGTYRLPALKPAGDGTVLSLDGEKAKLRKILKDRITVLSFIYTRCADPRACPYATGVLYKVHSISEQDPVIAKNLQLITLSFDPDHDTPRTMADYSLALRQPTGSEWLFLTTASPKDLTPILSAYGQQIDRRKDPQHPLGPYYHLLRVFLIDRQGMIRNIYSSGVLDPRLVLTDVRTLLLEEDLAKGSLE
jgi:cytochrome oxidase Cu insertion factor (SCO1/SenC/PrrC family)